METFWFIVVTLMLSVYAVLDGFDFGMGIISLIVARTEPERRLVLKAIGPMWNGNEVWLIASGGIIFLAFPRAYAAGFSGFYLALILVLWLLMFRGLAIELRSHIANPVWTRLWDTTFSLASLFLAVVFGVALGNLIRGVPLDQHGYFFTALWTTFSPGLEPGILDWFTILMGVLGVTLLGVHGAQYLAMKTEGPLHKRTCSLVHVGGLLLAGLTILAGVATVIVQPGLRHNYDAHPVGYLLPLLGVAALAGQIIFRRRGRDSAAFMASSLLIVAFLGSIAWGLYPNLLIATKEAAASLTIYNAAASPHGLRIALLWFGIGISLVVMYTVYVYRSFWGNVRLSPEDDSY